MNENPIVRVVWQDITAYDDWRDKDTPSPMLTIESIGYLLENKKDRIVIAASISEETTGNLMVLPPSVVKSITRLTDDGKIRKAG